MRSWTWPHYYICRTLAYCIFRLAGGYEVRGKENVPEGGALLAANHISYADPPAVGTAFRQRCYYFAKRQLFEIPLFGPFIRSLYAFPVNREGVDRKAIRNAAQLLKTGEKVIIFPEGGRSPDGTLQEGTEGAAFIAKLADAPIVPTALAGTDEVLPRGSIFLHRGKTTVSFGEPVYVTDYRDEEGDIDLRAATDEVMKRISRMIDEIRAERQARKTNKKTAVSS
ncbi:MAG: lysophospholipid acyltransferase family protein [Armatimonadota bacterium]